MKKLYLLFAELTVLAFTFTPMASAGLTNRYVVKYNAGAAEPYDTVINAAPDIQTAVDYAYAGETVLVAAATYDAGGITNYPTGTILTNRVAIWKAITVRSADNDPTNTIIYGAWNPVTTNGPAAVRCVYMTNNSRLIGFTLTNGATLTASESAVGEDRYGGGVFAKSSGHQLSNCVIMCNSAAERGGGAYLYGGIMNNCTLTNNSTAIGGGVFGTGSGILSNCMIVGNSASADGGGARGGNLTLYNCTLVGNSSVGAGGGVANNTILYNCMLVSNSSVGGGGGTSGNTLYNCTLTGNSATRDSGGAAYYSILYNCTLTGNSAPDGGGTHRSTLYNCLLAGNSATNIGGGANYSYLYNCTLTGNLATNEGGGMYAGTSVNSIVYFNTATSNLNWASTIIFTNSCTTPTNADWPVGNTTNDPMLVNRGAGNYRLNANSPCVNAGTNYSWMTNSANVHSKDLDGRTRIRYGTVDMGAYEFILSGTIYCFH